jgi:hypothetical protein
MMMFTSLPFSRTFLRFRRRVLRDSRSRVRFCRRRVRFVVDDLQEPDSEQASDCGFDLSA